MPADHLCPLPSLPDATDLTSLTVPGTHDTMTAACRHPYYRTQDLSLAEQLAVGVRFLDLRLRRTMVAAHREWVSDVTGQEILDTLRAHLAAHPRDLVLARFQNANEAKDDFEAYGQALHALVRANRDLFWQPPADGTTRWPYLGEARGKVLALECAPPALGLTRLDGRPWALPWHDNPDLLIQDDWDGPRPQDKIKSMRALYHHAGDRQALMVNHVSATNGEPGNPAAYAEVMNPAALTMLREGGGRGVLAFDFITPGLVAAAWRS